MLGFLFQFLRVILFLILPFLALVRGSVFFHTKYDWSPWFSLLGGIGITSLVLLLYLSIFFGKISGKLGSVKSFKNRWVVILIMLFGFAVHGLFFLSSDNTKRSEVNKEFSSLHPILRLGVSTLIWFDKELVITDAKRVPEDYKKMGMPTAKNSLHYPQADGYAYALDLRTNYRNEFRNQLNTFYFKLMGFNTLRHVGTADHLHVSLNCQYKRGGI